MTHGDCENSDGDTNPTDRADWIEDFATFVSNTRAKLWIVGFNYYHVDNSDEDGNDWVFMPDDPDYGTT